MPQGNEAKQAKTDQKTKQDSPKSRRDQVSQFTDSAVQRARSTVASLEANPLSVLVGGLAAGIVAGAVIPRSERERSALAPLGKRLAEGATAAVAAAKETGKEQMSGATLSRDAAKETARKVFESALGAARGKTPASEGSQNAA
jgi:hypothetical protein